MCLARRVWSSAPAQATLRLALVLAVVASLAVGLGLPPFNKSDPGAEAVAPVTSFVAAAPAVATPAADPAPPPPQGPKVPPTPGVLTVSAKWDDGGQYRTITEALAAVKPGDVVRVLDDAEYPEPLRLDDAVRFRDMTLEAVRRATIRRKEFAAGALVEITGAERVTVRGFRLAFEWKRVDEGVRVVLGERCSAVRIEELDFVCGEYRRAGVIISRDGSPASREPTRVERCTFTRCSGGVVIDGRGSLPGEERNPFPVAHVRILDNRFTDTASPVYLDGRYESILVAGNCMTGTDYTPFVLDNPHPDNTGLLIANNTLVGARTLAYVKRSQFAAFGGRARVTGNLLLGPGHHGLVRIDRTSHGLMPFGMSGGPHTYGDLDGGTTLAKLWTFSYNWRETDSLTTPPPFARAKWVLGSWAPNEADREIMRKNGISIDVQGVPAFSSTNLVPVIEGIDRDPKSPTYLSPSQDSPLATSGPGRDEPGLPKYVGALPPAAWNWDRTGKGPK